MTYVYRRRDYIEEGNGIWIPKTVEYTYYACDHCKHNIPDHPFDDILCPQLGKKECKDFSPIIKRFPLINMKDKDSVIKCTFLIDMRML